MEANDKKYPKARYDSNTNPQVYGFKIGKIYQFRDFGRGVEVFYGDGCALAMGHNAFNECFTVVETNKAPEKIYVDANEGWLRTFIAFTDKAKGNDIEYICTDAFIEKACEAYCKVCKMPNCKSNECKWISDFKGHLETI